MSETRYAQSGDVSIAYRIYGSGPLDLVVVPGIVSHVEAFDELPGYARFLRDLSKCARVITFDKRGNGLSDRVAEPPSLEERMDDVRAVLDATGSARAVLFGISEGAPMSLLFAAAHPERTRALVLFGAFPRVLAAPDFPDGWSVEAYESFTASSIAGWGTGQPLLTLFGPSLGDGADVRAIAARCERASATPTTLRALWRMTASIDVRDVLPRVAAPTLVMHRKGDRVIPLGVARWLAARLPDARLRELDGDDHFPFVGDADRVAHELTWFLQIAPSSAPTEHAAPSEEPPLSRTLEAPSALERLLTVVDFHEPLELGRFVVQRPLGSGAMGAVFLAHDRDLGRSVAIKVLRATDADSFRRFRREAMAIARLSHPNVVAIHELGLDEATPYLVMEYAGGGPLSTLTVVPWRRAARLVAGAARGLGAAHARGIVHRDIKPGNLLLMEGSDDVVKVADFGLAKLVGADPLTRDGAVVGTIGYIAPEQLDGGASAKVDVYALGMTLYRLLVGRLPWSGTPSEMLVAAARRSIPDPRQAGISVPPSIAALVARLGALDPAERPLDGAAAAEAIEDAVNAAGPVMP
jgi:pimeloyl-ACP methyl ester carboxylesterase